MPYFDDDGNELFPHLLPRPVLCTLCRHNNNILTEIKCNLTRLDCKEGEEFKCYAYEPLSSRN